jgi:putative copper resistance protein D
MVDFGLIFARLLHYAATTTLFGVSLFPLYAYAGSEPEALGRWRRALLLWTAVASVLSGLLWFVFSAANMAGSLSDLADAEALCTVVRDTGFGVAWTARMLLAVIIVGFTAVRRFHLTTSPRNLVISMLAAMLLASLAGVGHTQVEERWASLVHVLSDAAHLLAAGAWLGGLIPLAYILATHPDMNHDLAAIDRVLLRFSGMGYMAVATLVGTGLVNSWFLVGSVSNLLATPYGRTLLAKLALFAGMLALAVANRFWLVPAISNSRLRAAGGSSAVWLRRLRIHVLGERLLGAMILLVVSFLGTMQPAIG